MKKISLIIVLLSSTIISCKKEHTCTCVTTINGFVDDTEVTVYPNITKSAAKSKCLNSTSTSGPAYTKTRECNLD